MAAQGPANKNKQWSTSAQPRVTWIAPASAPTHSGRPPKQRLRWWIIAGVVVGALAAGIVAYLAIAAPGSEPAGDPLQAYLTATDLHDKGRDVEAMALLRQIRPGVTDPKLLATMDALALDIELTGEYRLIQQLIDAGSIEAAKKNLVQLLDKHPRQRRAEALLASLRATSTAKPAPAKTAPAKTAARPAAVAPVAVAPAAKTEPKTVNAPAPRRQVRSRRPARQTRRTSTRRAPPPPVPQAAAAAPQTGKVRVTSDVPAKIYLGGRSTGKRTPATLELKAGQHRIELVSLRDGISRRAKTVQVTAGAATSAFVRFGRRPTREIDENNPYAE